jgi:hypothetical protein
VLYMLMFVCVSMLEPSCKGTNNVQCITWNLDTALALPCKHNLCVTDIDMHYGLGCANVVSQWYYFLLNLFVIDGMYGVAHKPTCWVSAPCKRSMHVQNTRCMYMAIDVCVWQ